ncbi:MAG: glycosyltransferase family 2 protein [Bacteroidia bacterium]|nr:glycosyltransferase family 2 protein [Bacteroidia bacterium]MDW8348278.1 glycosyltransferase family 2 protein [Bacteroidia bacterium]
MAKISIIIPCYFNEENIPVTTEVLVENELRFPQGTQIEYVLVDDGSKDGTWQTLQDFRAKYPQKDIKIIKLAGNVGSHNAILAGMHFATGDCNVFIAADLQDPPELIPQMFEYWQKGIRLVIANRTDREDSFFQKVFANTYHYLMRKLALKNVPRGGFDLILFDRAIKDEIIKMNEKNTNILYLMTWLNYEYVNIPYVRKKREIGKSRWTLKKKIKLFIDSFVSFSFFPIRLISVTGLILGFIALLYGLFLLIAKLAGKIDLTGWTSLMLVLLFVSSFQMVSLGILGEYIWRTLDATRNRPNFVIDKVEENQS